MYSTLGLLKRGAGGGGSSGGGTYPSIASLTLTTEVLAPYNVDMPATVAAGDLLIMLLDRTSGGSDPSGGAPTGWSVLFAGLSAGYYKWAAGTEGGTAVTAPGSGSTDVLFSVLRIQGADSAQNPQGVYSNAGSTATPNPAAVDPTWADFKNLIIAWAGTVSVRNIVSYPSGYTFHQQEQDGTHGTIFVAAKQVTVSTSEDPGVFTISSAIDTYVATIAVKGAP